MHTLGPTPNQICWLDGSSVCHPLLFFFDCWHGPAIAIRGGRSCAEPEGGHAANHPKSAVHAHCHTKLCSLLTRAGAERSTQRTVEKEEVIVASRAVGGIHLLACKHKHAASVEHVLPPETRSQDK